MTRRELELQVTGTDEASGPFSEIAGSVLSLDNIAAGAATGGLALLTGALVGAGAAAVSVASDMIGFSMEIDESMSMLAAQTGATNEELAQFEETARDVYTAGFGESFTDIADEMSVVARNTGLMGDELGDATRRALILRDTFDFDVAESISTVESMIGSGLVDSSEEAFDLITTGFQEGLNVADDFSDTLNEYSSDFARLGFTADDTFALLNAGLEAGAYNTDVIADGFREMNIRLMEGGEGIEEVFDSIGMNFDQIQASVATGDETWGEYTTEVISRLAEMDDEVERNRLGVALFGTKWEDVGGQVFLAAGTAESGVEDLTGATDEAGERLEEGLPAAIDRLKRSVQEGFEPMSGWVVDMVNEATPYLEDLAAWIGENLPERVDKFVLWVDSKFVPAVEDVGEAAGEFVSGAGSEFNEHLGDIQQSSLDLQWAFHTELTPAIDNFIGAATDGRLSADDFWSTLGGFAGWLAGKYLATQLSVLEWWAGKITWGFDRAAGAVSWLRTQLDNLKQAFDALREIPAWLIPKSPTPFEMGIRGIGDALNDLPDMRDTFSVEMGGGGGGTRNVTIQNHFGADSVRSEQDIIALADRIARQVELRTGGLPL